MQAPGTQTRSFCYVSDMVDARSVMSDFLNYSWEFLMAILSVVCSSYV